MKTKLVKWRCTLLVLSFVGLTPKLKAQQVKNQFQLIGEVVIPGGEYNVGGGAQFKWLHQLGSSGQFTLSAGYAAVGSLVAQDGEHYSLHAIPFLGGYRYTYKKIFVEGQAGYGELGGRISKLGDFARPSVGAFYWGLMAGFKPLNRFEVGFRYLSGQGAEGSQGGLWHDYQFDYMGISVAFNLRKTLH